MNWFELILHKIANDRIYWAPPHLTQSELARALDEEE